MKNKLFYGLIVLIALVSLGIIITQRINDTSNGQSLGQPRPTHLEIGDKSLVIEIAQTEAEKSQGLSNRESLAPNTGMLFMFDKPDFYQFWMKDMNFPIDIVWLDQNYQIVDLTKNLSPDSYPTPVTSLAPAQFVLEINTGVSDNYQLKIGDKLKLK